MFVSIPALVIIRLSRTMRSLKHLLELVGELRERGVGLAVLMQHIDATMPTGRLAFNSGEEWPQRKITIGLSPASLPKRGSWFDLAGRAGVFQRKHRGRWWWA